MIKRILLVLRMSLSAILTVLCLQAHASAFFFADALMWQVRESNASNWGQALTPLATNETIQFFEVPFKYSSGFRMGGGYQKDSNPWQIEALYTGYSTQGRNAVSTTTAELHPAFSGNFYANNPAGNGISGPYYHQAAIQWDVNFKTLDILLGRLITPNKPLRLQPFAGIKAARINQTILSQWGEPFEPTTSTNPTPTPITTFSVAGETITNQFKGIGPSLGLYAAWDLFANNQQKLSIVSNTAGALLWSTWRFSDQYVNNTPQQITTQSDPLSSSTLMVQAFLGIEYTGILPQAAWSIRLGYEQQAWFNQLQYYSFDMGKTNDTLYLQGGVLGFNIDFN